jgi:hypothetical protein
VHGDPRRGIAAVTAAQQDQEIGLKEENHGAQSLQKALVDRQI